MEHRQKILLQNKIIWQVSREYAGIAEAGGVKNVARSLAEGLTRRGANVTQFIPLYGSISAEVLGGARLMDGLVAHVLCGGTSYEIRFYETVFDGVRIVFADNELFRRKKAVYTYTGLEERENPAFRHGKGHHDSNLINVVFQKSVLLFARLNGIAPDVLQCQDAHTALIPAFATANPALKELFHNTRFIVTIHNAGPGYHQQFSSIDEAYQLTELPYPLLQTGLLDGAVEPFLIAANLAVMTTVSPWYAAELMDGANDYSGGLSRQFAAKETPITGITNGVDLERYDPSDPAKSGLSHAFNPLRGELDGKYKLRASFAKKLAKDAPPLPEVERFGSIDDSPDAVWFAYQGRIAHQKGLDVLAWAAQLVLDSCPQARFLVTGQGDSELEEIHIHTAARYAGRYVYLRGYERTIARTCVAAGDFLVLPSIFEPCGLEDYIGQIYGTLPVAHAVGGLQKIIDGKTGFLYHENTPDTLSRVLTDLCRQKNGRGDFFAAMIRAAAVHVAQSCSWDAVIENQYIPLYFPPS